MAGSVARVEKTDAGAIVRHLHKLVIYGPWDLDIASAMSSYGYDAVKWAEGESLLAELVNDERLLETSLATALEWYNEAANAARRALAAQPQLLEKLGMA
jgi:hypothetical protein